MDDPSKYSQLLGKTLDDNPTLKAGVDQHRQTNHGEAFNEFDLFENTETVPMNTPNQETLVALQSEAEPETFTSAASLFDNVFNEAAEMKPSQDYLGDVDGTAFKEYITALPTKENSGTAKLQMDVDVEFTAVKQEDPDGFCEAKLAELVVLVPEASIPALDGLPPVESECAGDETDALVADDVVENVKLNALCNACVDQDAVYVDTDKFFDPEYPEDAPLPVLVKDDETKVGRGMTNPEAFVEHLTGFSIDNDEKHLPDESSFVTPVEIPGIKEAAEAGEVIKEGGIPQSAIMVGAGSSYFGGAMAVAAAHQHKQDAEEPTEFVPPTGNALSNSERKRQAAEEHNARLNRNKVTVVKIRILGKKVQLEVIRVTNRQVNLSREKGLFAVYTLNTAISGPALNQLPVRQHHNKSSVSPVLLDWLLDQIGETEAFEIRSGRITPETKRKFVIEHDDATWVAKGFHIFNDKLHLV
jgi:hypothetical protein